MTGLISSSTGSTSYLAELLKQNLTTSVSSVTSDDSTTATSVNTTLDLYSNLLENVDANEDGSISISELTSYLSSLKEEESTTSTTTNTESTSTTSNSSNTELSKEINFVEDLIENFDDFSNDEGEITQHSFYKALYTPQTPSSVTSEQLNFPINILI